MRSRFRGVFSALTAALLITTFASAADAAPSGQADVEERIPASPENPPDIEPGKRDATIGGGWQKSQDRLWTTSGDATGFHILVAEASTGYTWRTAATLSEGGAEADQWIGNACLTASGRRVVAVYAPRTYTNQEKLFDRGGFTAVVDLVSGAVTKLPVRTSLAYFNPGCGAGENAVLTQGADQDLGKTGLLTVNAETGALGTRIEIPGQLTSPVPTANGIVAADANSVVRLTGDGQRTLMAETAGVPMYLAPDATGGVAFIDRDGPSNYRVRRAESVGNVKVKTSTLASGRPQQIGITRGAANKVFIVGKPDKVNALPSSVARIDAPVDAEVSTTGEAVLTDVRTGPVDDPAEAARVAVAATSLKTGKSMAFTVDPADVLTPRSAPTDDPGRFCAVPRNDPATQVYQPKPKQVEWAADMAVKNHLYVQRPGNWRNNGLGAYTPQGLFPPVSLANTTDGQVPAQILLGVMGQESNLWQASRLIYPGETGNPLVGNYYGINLYDKKPENDWDIDFTKADCGYGVSQMTDGMRLAGHEKPGETALSWQKQKAIGTDYAANVAAGLQLLQRKWNEVQGEGLKLNNNDPAKPENWFYAVWAYNSGYHFKGEPDSAGAWGLGWQNNPANPKYPATRATFGTYAKDFSHPQDWPYPEKVLGFAGNTPSIFEAPGVEVPMFRPAWWNAGSDGGQTWKEAMRPPPQHFCIKEKNQCEYGMEYVPDYPGTRPGDPDSPGDVVGEPAGPCAHKNGRYYDLKCWWHDPSTWKGDCAVSCGNEKIRYDYPEYAAEPDDGISFPPNCDPRSIPDGALVIDDIADGVPTVRGPCDRTANAGKFEMSFGRDAQGREPSKVDLHQIGGGFGAHFWFSHTNRNDSVGDKLKVTGSWTLDQSLNSWARVYVHIPDHGAHTRNARYYVDLGNKTTSRVLPQRIKANQWVSLGSFPFAGVPKVTLTNIAPDGSNTEDVAWDAIAIQKLDAKPAHMVVAMGDSYASGEGASIPSGADFYPESDVDGKGGVWRDGCHRSKKSWSRGMTLSGSTTPVGTRADQRDPNVDYRMVACSGARIRNLLVTGGAKDAWGQAAGPSFSEVSQLDSGWVDENTTLVTLSAGGNDARFAKVLALCIYWPGGYCQDTNIDGEPEPLSVSEPKIITEKVKPSMVTLIDEIHRLAPSAKILLMGYPQLFSNLATCMGAAIEYPEFDWINLMGDKLNSELAAAVQQAQGKGISVAFADPTADFMGKGVCGNPQVIHGLVATLTPGDDPLFVYWPGKGLSSAMSFHPRIEGAATYAVTANRALRTMGL